jgi:predicted ABC-type ATPase
MAKPWFWLVAGPDGAGKSTFVASQAFQDMAATPESGPATFLSPDPLVAAMRADRPELPVTQAWRLAAERIDTDVARLVREGRPLVVETILTTPKYEPLVEEAKRAGYLVGVVYVILQRPTLHMERIAQRVAIGGHDVGGEKVIERWNRSLGTLPWFAERADYFSMWDNSELGGPPKLLIEATANSLFIAPAANAAIKSDMTHASMAAALQNLVTRLAA